MGKDVELFGKKFTNQDIIAAALAVLGVVIVAFVIIPQISSIGAEQEKVSEKSETVATLQQSLSVISGASPQKVEDDLKLVNKALPTNKNIISVFSTISNLASDANVVIEGFTIKVGNLYTKDEDKKETQASDAGFPSLDVIINVSAGDDNDMVTFSKLMYETLPLAQIKTLSSENNTGVFEVSFYYKPYDLDSIQNTNEVKEYSAESGTTISTLEKWDQ